MSLDPQPPAKEPAPLYPSAWGVACAVLVGGTFAGLAYNIIGGGVVGVVAGVGTLAGFLYLLFLLLPKNRL